MLFLVFLQLFFDVLLNLILVSFHLTVVWAAQGQTLLHSLPYATEWKLIVRCTQLWQYFIFIFVIVTIFSLFNVVSISWCRGIRRSDCLILVLLTTKERHCTLLHLLKLLRIVVFFFEACDIFLVKIMGKQAANTYIFVCVVKLSTICVP